MVGRPRLLLVTLAVLCVLGTAALDSRYRKGPGFDLTDFGAVPDDATDDAPALRLALAACQHGTLHVPPGTFTIGSQIAYQSISPAPIDCTIECADRRSSILDCSAVTSGACFVDTVNGTPVTDPSQYVAATVNFKHCGFKGARTGGASPIVIQVRRNNPETTIEDVAMDLVTGKGVNCATCTGLTVKDSLFFGDGDIQSIAGTPHLDDPTGVYIDVGAQNVVLDNDTFDYLNIGVSMVGTAASPVRNVRITNATVDGGFFTQKRHYSSAIDANCVFAGEPAACCTGAGTGTCPTAGTITYDAVGVGACTGAGAPDACCTGALAGNCGLHHTGGFTTQTVYGVTQVRVAQLRVSGTLDSVSAGNMNDAGVNFTTAGVIRGDLVATPDAFAIVEQKASATALTLTPWRSKTTYRIVPTPAPGTAYVVKRTVLGTVSGPITAPGVNTPDFVPVLRWRDFTGATVIPATDDAYEVQWDAPQYGIKSTTNVDGVTIENFLCLRNAGACVELSGNNNTMRGMTCRDGMDFCGSVQNASRTVIEGNTSDHMARGFGSYGGVGATGNDNILRDNTMIDDGWSWNTDVAANGGDIQIKSSDRNLVAHNIIRKGSFTAAAVYGTVNNNTVAILLDDDPLASAGNNATGNVLDGNLIDSGWTDGGIELIDADVENTAIVQPNGAVVVIGAGATGTTVDGVPAGATTSVTCAAGTAGVEFWDTDVQQRCVCVASGTVYCPVDGASCASGTSTSCG